MTLHMVRDRLTYNGSMSTERLLVLGYGILLRYIEGTVNLK